MYEDMCRTLNFSSSYTGSEQFDSLLLSTYFGDFRCFFNRYQYFGSISQCPFNFIEVLLMDQLFIAINYSLTMHTLSDFLLIPKHKQFSTETPWLPLLQVMLLMICKDSDEAELVHVLWKITKDISLKKVSAENCYRYILYVSSVTFVESVGHSISDITCKVLTCSFECCLSPHPNFFPVPMISVWVGIQVFSCTDDCSLDRQKNVPCTEDCGLARQPNVSLYQWLWSR